LEHSISIAAGHRQLGTTGPAEQNLKIIRDSLDVAITCRDSTIRIVGEAHAVARATNLIQRLSAAAEGGRPLERQELLDLVAAAHRLPMVDLRPGDRLGDESEPASGADGATLAQSGLDVYLTGRRVYPKTPGQQDYVRAVLDADLTFCSGPAGTGKTYLAVAAAISMLKGGQVRKIVLVRPAVEAGEKLGFLPGNMQDKINPYLRPLLDALHDMMNFDDVQRFVAGDVIEIIPLAFMRGRTLNDAIIILDEAQNTTRLQMLMFLTRMGHGSKMIVTGDTSQIDLDDPRKSGLIDAVRRLRRVKGIAFVTLGRSDIVRHSLVQRVVQAYEPPQSDAEERP
jgi:phosphate starvation-inducible PhoH-like protein